MRRYLYIIVALALFVVSCNDEKGDSYIPRNNTGEVEQTTIMYFMGTNLSWAYNGTNIPAVRDAISDGALGREGRLLIFIPNSSGAKLYEIYRTTDGYSTEEVVTYTSNESLDKSRICDVIQRSKEFAPAKTYNLILSGHGTGWVLSSHPSLRSIMSSDDINWDNMGTGEVVTRFMGCSSDGYMNVEELREALDETSTKFGYILFDMCFMSNIETLYEFKGVCCNVIASPCEVMGDGFPYVEVLPELFDNDGKTVNYAGVCKEYYIYYLNHNVNPCGAVTWCKTAYLEDVATAMKSVNNGGVESVDIKDLQCYETLPSTVFCDFGNYVSSACKDATLYEEFVEAFDRAFPYEGRQHTSQFYTTLNGYGQYVDIDADRYSGVSTSEPSTKFRADWVATSWAVATAAE